MKYQWLAKIVLSFFLLIIAGCKTTEMASTQVSVSNLKGTKVVELEQSKHAEFFKNLENRKQAIFKKKPSFEYKLTVKNGDSKSKWLYSTNGVLTSASKNDGVFYTVAFPEINQLLNQ